MQIAEHVEALWAAGDRLADVVASTPVEATVPSCPGWTVRDLVRHLGGVQRWATEFVATARKEPWDVELDEVVDGWPSDDTLVEWFRKGHAALVDTLAGADPALECWTFLAAPSPLAMWARRQAHEAAVHRVDAELAAGTAVEPFAPMLAADGVDELLSFFIVRPSGRLRADPPRTLAVRCTDTAGEWAMVIGPDRVETERHARATADCTVAGPASELYLALWNRGAGTDLAVEGDRGVLDLFGDRVRVRWS